MNKPLKALLYSILPTDNKQSPLPQLQNLAKLLNQRLTAREINVQVYVMNPKEQYNYLYNYEKTNELFNGFDIIQIDVLNLWAIKEKLMIFTQEEIAYYDKLYPFQWQPVTRQINGKSILVGSPAILCSQFIQKRQGQSFTNQIYAEYNHYTFVSFYLNYFVNRAQTNTIQSTKNKAIDEGVIDQLADFLRNLRKYDGNLSFFQTDAAYTFGFSENLSNFQKEGYDINNPNQVKVEHIVKDKPKKLVYIDAFIAKDTSELKDRVTILKFYEFMVSDEALDIYIKGLYTQNKRKTYIIPPTVHYLEEIAKGSLIFEQIVKLMKNSIQLPVYSSNCSRNAIQFGNLIMKHLKERGIDL